jgi:hypothetical protein
MTPYPVSVNHDDRRHPVGARRGSPGVPRSLGTVRLNLPIAIDHDREYWLSAHLAEVLSNGTSP